MPQTFQYCLPLQLIQLYLLHLLQCPDFPKPGILLRRSNTSLRLHRPVQINQHSRTAHFSIVKRRHICQFFSLFFFQNNLFFYCQIFKLPNQHFFLHTQKFRSLLQKFFLRQIGVSLSRRLFQRIEQPTLHPVFRIYADSRLCRDFIRFFKSDAADILRQFIRILS